MGYPFGKAPLADGTGTTPTDLQRIIGAQYASVGLLPDGGGRVSGTSSMAYAVTSGAAVMWTSKAARLAMVVPFEATTVQTDPAPATGSRVDTVYVDDGGAVRVAIGAESAPAGTALLGRFNVPAGITATSGASERIDRDFAIGTGSSLGRMAHWRDPGGGAATMGESTKLVAEFPLPSDRLVEIRITTTLRSVAGPGSMYFDLTLESPAGSVRRRLDVAHGPDWDTRSASWSFGTGEGTNTLTVVTKGTKGGAWQFSSGGSVTEVSLWDAGVLR